MPDNQKFLLALDYLLGPIDLPLPNLANHQWLLRIIEVRTFALENGGTRVSTSFYFNLNVEHMQSRLLMGKLVGKQFDVRTIKWEFGLALGSKGQKPFLSLPL